MKFLLILFLAISLSSSLTAQQGNMPKGLDGGKFTPKNSPKKEKQESGTELGFNNLIGLSAAHLFRQIAVLSYERHLGNRFGAKASLGYCFGKDKAYTILDEENSSYNTPVTLKDIIEQNPYNSSGPNYYADATAKVYTNLNESMVYDLLFRFYAGISYRNYRQTFNVNQGYSLPTDVKTIPVNNSAISLVIGQMAYRQGGMYFEYYLGLGRINSSYNGFIRDQTTGNYQYNYAKTYLKKALLTVGVVYGIGF